MRIVTFCLSVLCLATVGLAVRALGASQQGGEQASAPTAQAAPSGNVANGKKIFVSYGCYQCHGYAAQGGNAGPKLAPRPLAFAAFTRQVRQPRDEMPPYSPKVASDQDLADIYAFLLTIPASQPVSSIPLLNKP